jgi:hypothetical protein
LFPVALAVAAPAWLAPATAWAEKSDKLDGVVRLFVEKPGAEEAAPEAEVGDPDGGAEKTTVPDVGTICKLLKLTEVIATASA